MTRVPNLITVEFLAFVKSQFTTVTQNVHHLNHCMHGHVKSWTAAPFQRPWVVTNGSDRHQKCVGEVSLNFQLQLNILGFVTQTKI
jgi:hypothetical protein